MRRIFVTLLVISATALSSQGESKYDYKTGNSYYSSGSGYRGYNYNTGSQWGTNPSRGGKTSGYDSKGNYWQYNRSSGGYYNYGTGESRYRGKKMDW